MEDNSASVVLQPLGISQVPQNQPVPVPEKKKSRLKRIVFSIGITLVLLIAGGVALAYFTPQVYIVAGTRIYFSKTKHPSLYIIPETRDIESIDTSGYSRYSYYGTSIVVPWEETPEVKELENVTLLDFSDGKSVVFHNPSKLTSITSSEELKKNENSLAEAYGEENVENDYKLMKLILNSSPEAITLSSSPKEAAKESTLVVMKKATLVQEISNIIDFATEEFHGFQIGDPSKDKVVIIELFDSNNKKYQLWIQNKNLEITQRDINTILSSFSTN